MSLPDKKILISHLKFVDENLISSTFYIWQMIRFRNAKCPGKYVIFILDPDVPGYKFGEFYNHLTISELSCDDLKHGSLNSAVTNLRYESPNFSIGSKSHRFMLLIYKQDPSSEPLNKIPNIKRSNWSLDSYLSKHRKTICGPVAGTQFRILP